MLHMTQRLTDPTQTLSQVSAVLPWNWMLAYTDKKNMLHLSKVDRFNIDLQQGVSHAYLELNAGLHRSIKLCYICLKGLQIQHRPWARHQQCLSGTECWLTQIHKIMLHMFEELTDTTQTLSQASVVLPWNWMLAYTDTKNYVTTFKGR